MPEPKPSPVIRLRGVRHNNLKNFDLDLPLHRLIVVTGLSGSGKSSLAFDTLFAEGQRRYIETFSPYARQFFDRMDKSQVDSIEGIPPAIAIEQRNSVRTTRSTVGTMTEICDYLKVLWPHVAQLRCRQCGQPVHKEPPQTIWETLKSPSSSSSSSSSKSAHAEDENENEGGESREYLITFDLALSDKLSLADSLALIAKQGYQRLLADGELVRVDDAPTHSAFRAPHSALTVVQDRLRLADANRARFVEACEQAYHFGKGKLAIHALDNRLSAIGARRLFSNGLHCATCNIEYREPSPALFSFNHPLGACPVCKGFGRIISIDYELAIPDRSLTLAGGAVKPWRSGFSAECQGDLLKFCKVRRVPTNVAFRKLSADHQLWVIEGDPGYGSDKAHEWPHAWYGVKGYFRWLESKAYKMHVRVLLSRYRAYTTCPDCRGARLKPEALLYRLTIQDLRFARAIDEARAEPARDASIANPKSQMTLADFYALPVCDALAVIERLSNKPGDEAGRKQSPIQIALEEVRSRLGYLNAVGLGYLTLDRPTRTLSGGETERVNLTTCLGTRLVNTLFVLDEPSVGLHPRDTERLVRILQQLRDAGNTVVVVEHEASVMRAADQIVDLGPGHGATGGQAVFQGTFAEILKSKESLTGRYLSGRKRIEIPERRPVLVAANVSSRLRSPRPNRAPPNTATVKIANATRHNLKNFTVEIPLGRFVCVTGVSGSGKTTLVREVLLPALKTKLQAGGANAKASDRLETNDGGNPDEGESSPIADRQSPILSGWESLGRVVLVDQSILGKTPRSNPAVYIGAFDDIREFFAQSEPARQRGLNVSAFSFNSGQGQCERCRGAGFEKIEMQFLSDVFIRCAGCNGRRYRTHVLDVKVRNHRLESPLNSAVERMRRPAAAPDREWSIADLLEATVDEVIDFLAGFPDSKAAQRAGVSLKLLQEVGLGYLRLGQPINTLSGGESQRLKLVRHLAEAAAPASAGRNSSDEKPANGGHRPSLHPKPALFLFDEPTTGLHFDDVRLLLKVFQRLVDAGHSVVVIEHNLDVIKCADWLIDLGPDAGNEGGQIVAEGTPEQVAACPASHTGRFLREMLSRASKVGDRKPGARALIPPSIFDSRLSTAICIHGAREHNLKNLSLQVPRNQFVVITGVSGSGKSTLAFDILFAEGQRRFLDSMNVYARQFVEQLARPDVDLITGIPPTVSIEQRISRGGGKSTVATITEVYHFLRLLFARLGTQYCPDCQVPVEAQTRDQVGRHLQDQSRKRGDLLLLAPVVKNRKGFHTDVAEWAAKHGYQEVRADGKIHPTSERLRLDRFREHTVEVVVGVVAASRKSAAISGRQGQPRSREAQRQVKIDEALRLGNGTLFALDNYGQQTVHSTERACPKCGRSFEPLDPKNFSYNSPAGWCPRCRGFGELFYMPKDVDRGAREDAIAESWFDWMEGQREICPDCQGSRLNPIARAVRLSQVPRGISIEPTVEEFSKLAVSDASQLFRKLKLTGRAAVIARDILPEIRERLTFLDTVGLGYLQLGRGVPTLSGGESQRIRLAAQLGSNLSGVLYILDEPTIGLHPRDNVRLLAALQKLKARGNSVIVVEHDEATMRRADYVIDLGPGAGVHGGEVVAAGTLGELSRHPESITGRCLRAKKTFPTRGRRRPMQGCPVLALHNASANNLKNLTVRFPLGRLVLVTGVSGSGKSTLVRECLLPALQTALKSRTTHHAPRIENDGPGGIHVSGHESVRAVYEVDQSPIGRTPRSIPATYVGFFDDIRALFAQVPEARLRGYSPSRFSFNSAQGRCPECQGAGTVKLEMSFLPPAFVRCDTCGGSRFNRETLDIAYRGKTIAQVLDLSVEEAMGFFAAIPKIKRALQALHDTGLDYLKLGQTSPTLSGGEAQRVKLVSHLLAGLKEPDLFDRAPKRNLFILEEPTIGLHMADVSRLVEVLQRLVDAGHSVIVIEHNLDLIAEADWIIDLGPEGGDGGGSIVAEGAPEQIARNKRSHTGSFLRKLLAGS